MGIDKTWQKSGSPYKSVHNLEFKGIPIWNNGFYQTMNTDAGRFWNTYTSAFEFRNHFWPVAGALLINSPSICKNFILFEYVTKMKKPSRWSFKWNVNKKNRQTSQRRRYQFTHGWSWRWVQMSLLLLQLQHRWTDSADAETTRDIIITCWRHHSCRCFISLCTPS